MDYQIGKSQSLNTPIEEDTWGIKLVRSETEERGFGVGNF